MCRVHIVWQELKAPSLMLHKIWLSDKVLALLFGNSTAKAYLCDQGGTESLFLSRLVCCILNLANKHGITFIPAYIPTLLIWKPSIYHEEG